MVCLMSLVGSVYLLNYLRRLGKDRSERREEEREEEKEEEQGLQITSTVVCLVY